MTINVINLSPHQTAESMYPSWTPERIGKIREERVLSICKQSKEHGFAVRFWEGVPGKLGEGINKAFKNIVRWAKENNLDRVCIGEDDLVFSAPGAWQYYLDNIPDDYDIYLGGVYYAELQEGRIMNGYSGNTLITVHQRFYDFFINIDLPLDNKHLDRMLGCFAYEKKYIVCEPFVVSQLEGYSDNLRSPTKHSSYLAEMKLFGRD